MNQHLPTHRVSWHIDLPAANVQAAAGLALQIQRDPASTALVFEVERDGETVSVDLTPDVTFGRRSLRPGLEYQTRDGQPVQVLNWDTGEPRGIVIQLPDGSTAWRPKSGRVNPRGDDHPLDVLEVSSAITKWVRVYDRKLNENGKQVVGGKEFAAERGLNWYIFDTEEEARANLQGVRAVFPITYREGRVLGKPRRQTIWIDNARTRTAADISEVGECQALIRRISRNIEDLLQQGAGQPDCPRNLQQALHYRNLALRELESRYSQLIQQR